jgi:UDP-glucose 4-epimerase
MSVYGQAYDPPFTEDMMPSPMDPYAIAKYAVEQDLKVAKDQHGLKYVIIRPHNFYGVNQNIWDKYRNVLGIWMYQIINNESPTIFGDGLQKRAFSYIDDAMVPLWNASQNDECIGEIINLGGIQDHSVLDACEELLKVVNDKSIKPLHLAPRHESKYAYSTWDKSVKYLDFKHTINLDVGLEKMWQWAIVQPNRDRFFWDTYELNTGIYDYWKRETRKKIKTSKE